MGEDFRINMQFLRRKQCCFPAMHLPEVYLILAWIFLLYHDDVHIKSQQKSSVLQLEPCEQSQHTSPQTPLTLHWTSKKGKKNHLIGQNNHYRFLKMPQAGSDTMAVQLSSRPKSWHVFSWSPSLCFVVCNLTAAAEFSLKWSKHSRRLTWVQCSQTLVPIGATNHFLINYSH